MIISMFTTNNGRRISKSKSLPRWWANIQTSQMKGKEKEVIIIITISMAVAVAVVIAMETLLAEDAEDVEEDAEVAVGEETVVSIYRV
jgi:flagellar basal body-associated protein FliL